MILFGFGKSKSGISRPKVGFSTVSEVGKVRAENEDRVFVDFDRLVFCVADGIGGGSEGAVASEMVCANLKMVLYAARDDFSSRVAAVQQAVEEANVEIRERALRKGLGAMGSTAAIVVLDPADPRRAAVCNIGDSRVYLIQGGMPRLLTRDHRKEDSNTLTRAIGCTPEVDAEWREVEANAGARFLLCTDGVHDVLADSRIAVFAAGGTVGSAAKRLSSDVLKHGAPDNFSFVLISV